MKLKVKVSTYVKLTTLVVSGGLTGIALVYFHQELYTGGCVMIFLLLMLVTLGLNYAPMYVIVDSDNVKVKSLLKTWKIKLKDINRIEIFQPTIGAIRICASGGFMGHWGLYREGDVGNYIGFYGKSSDCFMIRLENGDKYVLGCEKPQLVVKKIRDKII
ncbi:MAG: PH domain-containing protein [Muribaculaceae bacterium]|nr:PH domain-containing protein [Muribaculaceae bacterium]